MFRRIRNAFLFVIAFVVSLTPSMVSATITQDILNFYSQNDILFYDPSGGCDTSAVLPVLGKNVTWIGDSYSVHSKALIDKKLPGVDYNGWSLDSEQTSYIWSGKTINTDGAGPGGMKILQKVVDEGKLRPYLVFALGGNSGITTEDIEKVINIAGRNTKIVFANLYMTTPNAATQAIIKSSNEALAEAEKKHSNIRVADWASIAKDEYYIKDSSGVHPMDGYEEWVGVIYKALTSFSGGASSSSSATAGNNQNYAGETVWSEEQLKAIEANRSAYEKAEKEYGIPWQAMATMHSLETGLSRSNPAGGQGLYALYSYTAGGTNDKAFVPAGPVSDAEFERQTLIAAEQMKMMIEAQGLEVNSDDGIKALLFQYNGKAKQYIDKALALGFTEEQAKLGEGSPYVMNRYDARRDPNSSQMDPVWPGRYVADGVYSPTSTQYDFGGFVKYIALKGSSQGGNICTTLVVGGNMDLNLSAIELAWPQKERNNTFSKGKPAYLAAIRQTWLSGYELGVAQVGSFNRGDGSIIPVGMSCDNFVGTVVRFSGIDPDFPVWLGSQKAYLESSAMWERVDVSDSSQVAAGDIRIENGGGHILMIVEVDGELKVASASSNERYGDIQNYYIKPGVTYRLKV